MVKNNIKSYRKRHPEIKEAWDRLKYKTKNFELDKAKHLFCINKCGRRAVSYHHADYKDDLVYPICQECHSKLHERLNKVTGKW